MRDIKFRAWNKKEKKMYFWDKEPYLSFYIGDYGATLSEAFVGANATEFMQFTGLEDKNGVEIYEGDLLKYDLIGGAKENIPVEGVEFINGKFGVWHYDFCGFDEIENYEVVGNVWENTELLK